MATPTSSRPATKPTPAAPSARPVDDGPPAPKKASDGDGARRADRSRGHKDLDHKNLDHKDNGPKDRGHVVYARHQWFGFAVFGTLCLVAALVFSRWDPTTTESRWFWVIVGPIAGVIAMFRSQTMFDGQGADRDAGPYVGMLVGTTVGALVIGFLALDAWVMPSVFFLVAAFLAFMAWLEQSGIGMTTALTVTVLSAATAAAAIQGSVVLLSLMIGVMLLSCSLVLIVCCNPEAGPAT
jgi:hypothetical protein